MHTSWIRKGTDKGALQTVVVKLSVLTVVNHKEALCCLFIYLFL